MKRQFDAIVLGAGAAGLFYAAQAGQRGRKIVVVEHQAEAGRKIVISGGGRCNFTNIHTSPADFLSGNPHFAKSALARYRPENFLELVRKHQIGYHEKKLGQLFCDHSARQILDLLLAECAAGHVEILLKTGITQVTRPDRFLVETPRETLEASALVVATGGLSIPKLGATPLGYRLAAQFGHPVVACRPALVPLTFSAGDRNRYADLAGVSTAVSTAFGGQRFEERLLFTHRGVSGPAILQISSYWTPGGEIVCDLAPGVNVEEKLIERHRLGERAEVRTALQQWLPARLAATVSANGNWKGPVAGLPAAAIRELARHLKDWPLRPSGTEGYEKAEVTAGGVGTHQLSSQTLESKLQPGLFFIGEVVDVTGHLGGFNFQWAWASAYAAAQAL